MKTNLQLEQMEDALQTISEFSENFANGENCPMIDCMWHCLAFIGSKGEDFGESAARRVAKWYYNGQNTYGMFDGDQRDMQRLVNRYVYSRPKGSCSQDVFLFVYETSRIQEGNNTRIIHHVVVMYNNNYTNGESYYVFDPQSGTHQYISFSFLKDREHFRISVPL